MHTLNGICNTVNTAQCTCTVNLLQQFQHYSNTSVNSLSHLLQHLTLLNTPAHTTLHLLQHYQHCPTQLSTDCVAFHCYQRTAPPRGHQAPHDETLLPLANSAFPPPAARTSSYRVHVKLEDLYSLYAAAGCSTITTVRPQPLLTYNPSTSTTPLTYN